MSQAALVCFASASPGIRRLAFRWAAPSSTLLCHTCTTAGKRSLSFRRAPLGAPTRARLPSVSFSSSSCSSYVSWFPPTMTDAALSPAEQARLIEQSKRAAAYQAVEDHLEPGYRHIGIGSGSTVIYVVEAIAKLGKAVTDAMTFYPTGDQSSDLIEGAGLRLASIAQLPLHARLDVCFDGADEVDDALNLIKGGGACLFQEKIVATAAKNFICVADYRKLAPRLGTHWKQGIPIEVLPIAAKRVLTELLELGSLNPQIRQGLPRKAGPVVTDNSMWLIDAPFKPLLLPADIDPANPNEKPDGADGVWTADGLAARLIKIPGVVEIGLFTGFNGLEARTGDGGAQKPIAAYFGMADGSVQVRKA